MSTFVPLSTIPNFVPQQVKIDAWDAHLPPVPTAHLQLQALKNRFEHPPIWQPESRFEPPITERSQRKAAVLVAIVNRATPTLLLTQRTEKLSSHAGQIAFAGGKLDADETAVQAAMREAWEEIGLQQENIQILGTLPSYTTGTAFHIIPVVASISPDFELHLNPDEVADCFEVPLEFLMNPAHHARHHLDQAGYHREWFSMPWQDVAAGKERFIWGATAGMIRNLYRFLIAKPA